jgi:hypothetical protein
MIVVLYSLHDYADKAPHAFKVAEFGVSVLGSACRVLRNASQVGEHFFTASRG